MSHPKLGIDIDREDFMTKIRGVPVFPTQIELILDQISGLTGRCQITVDKRTPQQESTMKIEMQNSLSESDKHSICRKVVEEVKNRIGITFNDIVFVPLGTFDIKYDKAVVIE
jgi:phenylacetate-coenzyme A ligase PaaK-like adenylate-forming protein